MRKVIVLIFLVFIYGFGYAQIDSLSITQSRQKNNFWNSFLNTPITYQKIPIKDFTQTSLYSDIKKQDISKKQTPNKVSYFGFNSTGVFTLKNNLKLFGGLNFYRSYAKESAYLLMHNLSEEFSYNIIKNPHYPLAIRSGDSNNLHYKILGGITGFITPKIPFAAKINYNVEKYFGFTVPKTEQELLDIAVELQIGYSINNNTFYGITKLKRVQNSFNYTSQSIGGLSINSIAEPNYYAGLSNGYGDVLGFNSSLLDGFIQVNSNTFGVGYNLNKDSHFFNISYKYTDKEEKYFSTSYIDDQNLAATLFVTRHTVSSLYIKKHQQHLLLMKVKYIKANGNNAQRFLNYIENATVINFSTNYLQEIDKVTFDIDWNAEQNGVTKLGANFNFNLENENTTDTNTTFKDLLTLNTGFKLNKDYIIKKDKSFINLELSANYYTSLNSSLNYIDANSSTSTGTVIPPRQTFGEDVIIFDYNYSLLDKVIGGIDLNYNIKLKNKRSLQFVASYTNLRSITSNDVIGFKTNNYYSLRFNLLY